MKWSLFVLSTWSINAARGNGQRHTPKQPIIQTEKERGFYSNVKSSFLFVTPLGFKPRTFRTGI